GRPPFAVLLLRLRLLRVLLLAAVGLRALGGLLSTPSAVPVQRVVRMPRFGALAPAILSHRSPRAARWRSRGSSPASPPPLPVRCRFEHRRSARSVTVPRSDDHFDALSGCCPWHPCGFEGLLEDDHSGRLVDRGTSLPGLHARRPQAL